MKTLTEIKLVPVLDLDPLYLDWNFIGKTSFETKEAREEYWKTIWTNYGLGAVKPLKIGLSFVEIKEIDEKSLRRLVEMKLEEFFCTDNIEAACNSETVSNIEEGLDDDEYGDEEELPTSFTGGILLMVDKEILYMPQCCTSLQDHIEWSNVKPTSNPKHIWIGHPWLYYKTKGKDLYLTRLIEKDFSNIWRYYKDLDVPYGTCYSITKDVDELKIEDGDWYFKTNFHQFREAVSEMNRELVNFKARISKVVEDLGYENAEKLAECLVDGNGYMLSYSDLEP